MRSGKRKSLVSLLIGLFFTAMILVLFIHDASYIFTGKTVDLNEILESGGELPRDKYVSYTCEYPLGNYAEEQTYIDGFIPSPFKSQLYAMIDEYDGEGMIFSAKVNKKAKISEFDSVVDEQTESVTVVGCLQTISPDAFNYLEQSCGYIGGDDVTLTYYVIDSTKTRFSLIVLYTFGLAIGVFCLVTYFRKKG